MDDLQAELDVAYAQNARLAEANAQLRQQLKSFTNDDQSDATTRVAAKLNEFKFENECDRLYEKLEKHKLKYNQLHDAYLQKVKRCKAFEDVFSRQKTLNGLVMKSAIDQRQQEQDVMAEKRRSENMQKSSMEHLESEVTRLQTALDEAYDIIDELEFELESVDFLEMDNQRLQDEMSTMKKENLKLKRSINRSHVKQTSEEVEVTEEEQTVDDFEDDSEEPPEYTEHAGASRAQTDSITSSLAESFVGDMDPEVFERSALTESLIKTAESESNCLRRELLRSRLQRTIRRPAERPTSSDC